MQAKKTPLFDEHIRLNGKIVDFAGWQLPVQFTSLKEEHHNVRENVGIFDVSHMGEFRVKGPKALETLQWVTSNDVSKLAKGDAQYTLLTNFEGGIVDDLIVYCLEPDSDYLLCVNAANVEKDFAWIEKNNKGADLSNESEYWAQVAIQGPKAQELLQKVMSSDVEQISFFKFAARNYSGVECLVARTGYTGEDGFEVFVPAEKAVDFWQDLLRQGESLKVQPIGLGARDTLRLEMKFSLYGQDITDSTNPIEAGLGWAVKIAAKDFIGKDKIEAVKQEGPKRKLVGFKMIERGIPRTQYKLFSFDNSLIGEVTSGTQSPSLGEAIGVGYVASEHSAIGSEILVEIRQKKLKAEVIKTPFVVVNKK